ncbi:hypothetical protein B0H11DRAFT_1902580 [Mycena galericulata]|nr:hypothetical protein B0H11DRAFT_1935122 [Mycena galericulata]KAJ7507420.1 hypothetical protein B0H11DRAFT_1902580 [Mycena galericulata]
MSVIRCVPLPHYNVETYSRPRRKHYGSRTVYKPPHRNDGFQPCTIPFLPSDNFYNHDYHSWSTRGEYFIFACYENYGFPEIRLYTEETAAVEGMHKKFTDLGYRATAVIKENIYAVDEWLNTHCRTVCPYHGPWRPGASDEPDDELSEIDINGMPAKTPAPATLSLIAEVWSSTKELRHDARSSRPTFKRLTRQTLGPPQSKRRQDRPMMEILRDDDAGGKFGAWRRAILRRPVSSIAAIAGHDSCIVAAQLVLCASAPLGVMCAKSAVDVQRVVSCFVRVPFVWSGVGVAPIQPSSKILFATLHGVRMQRRATLLYVLAARMMWRGGGQRGDVAF